MMSIRIPIRFINDNRISKTSDYSTRRYNARISSNEMYLLYLIIS